MKYLPFTCRFFNSHASPFNFTIIANNAITSTMLLKICLGGGDSYIRLKFSSFSSCTCAYQFMPLIKLLETLVVDIITYAHSPQIAFIHVCMYLNLFLYINKCMCLRQLPSPSPLWVNLPVIFDPPIHSCLTNYEKYEYNNIHNHQRKKLTGVMLVKGHFACQEHTPNKNVCQVRYKSLNFCFHMLNDILKFYFLCHIYIYIVEIPPHVYKVMSKQSHTMAKSLVHNIRLIKL